MRSAGARHGCAWLAAALVASNVLAQPVAAPSPAPAATGSTAGMTEGEVRKIDKEGGKITLRHAPIVPLDMPAMTMVFRVRDPALLATLKSGDKVRFNAEKSQGSYWVTALEAAP